MEKTESATRSSRSNCVEYMLGGLFVSRSRVSSGGREAGDEGEGRKKGRLIAGRQKKMLPDRPKEISFRSRSDG